MIARSKWCGVVRVGVRAGVGVLVAASAVMTPGCATRSSRLPEESPSVRHGVDDRAFRAQAGIEEIAPGRRPVWWSDDPRVEAGAARICAMGVAPELGVAYAWALQNARNAGRIALGEDPAEVVVSKAAASRSLGGEYRVMILSECRTPRAQAAARAAAATPVSTSAPVPTDGPASPPRAATGSAGVVTPAPTPVATPAPAVLAPPEVREEEVAGAPRWYTDIPSLGGGRMTLGASGEGATLRDARRQAVDAAVTRFISFMRATPNDVRTTRVASEKLPTGQYRVYVLASAEVTPSSSVADVNPSDPAPTPK